MEENNPNDDKTPTINDKLSPTKKQGTTGSSEEFDDTLQNNPGSTLAKHRFVVDPTHPIRLLPYCLPQAYRTSVKEELKDLEASGVIEPSVSEWAIPIVLVKKKDGSLRFS